ncbi:MAG TPA: TonB-dependent receptor [Sphingobium sp.]|nr:TonB-dependent receptor [Sphingobium sp.]
MTLMVHARRHALLMAMAPLITPLIATVAHAQGATVPPQTAGQENAQAGQIEDIVVTAQRRSESAQSVPISLQSFSADSLQKTAVRSTEDLTSVVGGLLIQPTAARPAVFVRGVGTNSSNTTPAVLTFVDGVYMPFGQSMDLANVSSLEVLKGPQGTLFGRNATGGVIQITTRSPSETTAAKFEIGYGNYETIDATGYVTGGLASGVAADLSLRYSNQDKGFGTNVYNGDDLFKTRKFSGRARLRLDLSDVTNLTLAGDYNEVHGNVGTTVAPAFGYGSVFAGGAIRRRGPGQFYPGPYDGNFGPRTPGFDTKEWGTSLSFETEISDLTFRSITAYRESQEHIRIDFDGTPASIVNLSIHRDPRTSFTQELQLLSGSGGPLEWVAGLFYYHGKAIMSPFQINTTAAFAKDIDESGAAYAQMSYEVLPDTKLTLGGRYTIEKRSIDGYVQANGVTIPSRSGQQSQKFKEPTWRIALDHKFSPDILAYASVSRGFNAGFFNQSSLAGFANASQNPPVKPEFLTAYEVGTKADLFDRHLRVNLSAFLYDYKGLQQQIYNQGAVVTINAGSAEMKGVDFEFVAKPIRSLSLSLSGTYLDTKYKSYPLAPNYVPQANGSIIAVGNLDAAGNIITNTPEWSYTVSASHVLETSIGDFTTSANLNYRGKTYVDPANRFKLPTRYLLNVTERWTSSDDKLFASLWVKNVLDKQYDYAINILTPVGLVGNPAPPRTYGMSLGFNF